MDYVALVKKYLPILLVVVLGSVGWVAYSSMKPALVTVSAVGEVSVAPSSVSMVVTRVDASSEAGTAIDQNKAAMDQLIAKIKSLAGSDVVVKRSVYQVTPQNNQYVVVSGLTVKSKDVNGVNELVKQLYLSGATTVSNMDFEAMDKMGSEQLARKEAVKKATDQAKNMAKSAGKNLGRLISLLDDESIGSSGTVTDVSKQNDSKTIVVSKKVQMVYEIW